MGRLSLPGLPSRVRGRPSQPPDRPLRRYFPELVAGLIDLTGADLVLDGEIVVPCQAGLDFDALLARIHPAASWTCVCAWSCMTSLR